jgi:hypothetical protein
MLTCLSKRVLCIYLPCSLFSVGCEKTGVGTFSNHRTLSFSNDFLSPEIVINFVYFGYLLQSLLQHMFDLQSDKCIKMIFFHLLSTT